MRQALGKVQFLFGMGVEASRGGAMRGDAGGGGGHAKKMGSNKYRYVTEWFLMLHARPYKRELKIIFILSFLCLLSPIARYYFAT